MNSQIQSNRAKSASMNIQAWRNQQALDIQASKARMAAECGIARDAKFDKAWALAWDYGHSAGIDEVESYFRQLSELIK